MIPLERGSSPGDYFHDTASVRSGGRDKAFPFCLRGHETVLFSWYGIESPAVLILTFRYIFCLLFRYFMYNRLLFMLSNGPSLSIIMREKEHDWKWTFGYEAGKTGQKDFCMWIINILFILTMYLDLESLANRRRDSICGYT